MDVATITMEQDKAQAAFEDYQDAVKRGSSDPQDEALIRGYKFLAEAPDRRLLKLTETFERGGFDERGLPRLAIMRAGSRAARVVVRPRNGGLGDVEFTHDGDFSRPRHRNRVLIEGIVPAGAPVIRGYVGWTALVPIIPPPLRPARGVARYHVLWEAEWFIDRQAAPIDPYLVRHLLGDLWAVIAAWDLTELERAVLAARSG